MKLELETELESLVRDVLEPLYRSMSEHVQEELRTGLVEYLRRRQPDMARMITPSRTKKYDLIDSNHDRGIKGIVDRIDEYAPTEAGFGCKISRKLDNSGAWVVYESIASLGEPSGAVKQILAQLTDWEKVLFFVGTHSYKNRRKDFKRENRTLPGFGDGLSQTVGEYIIEGKKVLNNIRKSKGKKPLGFAKSPAYDHESRYVGKLAREFRECLEAERNGEEDARIQTMAFLEPCDDAERHFLTVVFGEKVLGAGYSVVDGPRQYVP